MKLILYCIALVVLLSAFGATTYAQDLDENENYQSFKSWAIDTQYPDPLPNMFKFCIQSYDKMIASGVSPSTRVPEAKIGDIEWKGTVQEIKEKWCDAGLKKTTADLTALHAPYKAVLKADKLSLVVDETHGGISSFAMPGGKYTDDPKLLAAAPVWFLDIGPPSDEPQFCASGGKRHSVRRYSFNAQHKLLGTTQKEYCGDPPASAYK
jgi:hypothetical protein